MSAARTPFGKWLDHRCVDLEITTAELAKRAGVTPAALTHLRAGRTRRPSPLTRRALEAVVGPIPDDVLPDRARAAKEAGA